MMVGAAVLLTACGNGSASTDSSSNSSTEAATEVTIQDSDGEVPVPKDPQKVVVFDNGSLDTLDALGVGERVIGAPTKSLPSYLASYQKVENAGGIKEPDLEKINQLQPDLIIISGRQRDFKEDLNAIAPTIFLSVDAKDTWNSTKQNIQTLATIFGKETVAKEKIATLDQEITALQAQAKDSGKALVTLVNEGQLSAYGKGSRFGIIHDTFGFPEADDKIEASTHGQSVSYEYVLEKNPDILFVIDRTKAIGGDTSKDDVAANELVKETNAGKNHKVIQLAPDIWYLSGGGLESTQKMIEDVKAAFE
ncbi:iron ABC transporter substrate-binding protein [Enterococcus canis]|uniref:Iron ABC transporter substrate-binding protein n=2 Tax=Enterococcus canis TaxID=214095 RepID=A0A1L8RGF2_9ENTE|nr:iron ABC transporter substrate-binding protein [Enterococcus canis]